jgi:hypothetical protein
MYRTGWRNKCDLAAEMGSYSATDFSTAGLIFRSLVNELEMFRLKYLPDQERNHWRWMHSIQKDVSWMRYWIVTPLDKIDWFRTVTVFDLLLYVKTRVQVIIVIIIGPRAFYLVFNRENMPYAQRVWNADDFEPRRKMSWSFVPTQ